jgi:anti-sigma factor RsiW
MTAHSPCNDESLLLFLHGELSRTARLRQALHLAGCPACRERLRQFTSISTKLATGLVQPGEVPRLRATKSPVLPAPLWVISALVLVILGSVGTLTWQWRKANPTYNLALPECAEGCEIDCMPAASQLKKP